MACTYERAASQCARIKHRTLPHPPEKRIATATMNHAADGATPDTNRIKTNHVVARSVHGLISCGHPPLAHAALCIEEPVRRVAPGICCLQTRRVRCNLLEVVVVQRASVAQQFITALQPLRLPLPSTRAPQAQSRGGASHYARATARTSLRSAAVSSRARFLAAPTRSSAATPWL